MNERVVCPCKSVFFRGISVPFLLTTVIIISVLNLPDHIILGQSMTAEARWVDSTLAGMTLEEKVGQLFIADFVAIYSHEESENFARIKRQIKDYHVGGIILAGGGVYDIALMTNELQRLSKTPLIVAADLEAGLGFWHPWRFVKGRAPDLPKFVSGGGTVFPGNMALGATGSE
ncbi:MAG: hypothetical protein AABZ61_07660, partial [Bacteroidota bacterium]